MTDDELYLYVTNDGDLYRARTAPLQYQLAAEKQKGTYKRSRALTKFQEIVTEGARKYRKEFGSAPFSAANQKATAEAMVNYFEIEYDLGNISSTGPSEREGRKTQAQIRREIDIVVGDRRRRR